MATLNSFLVNDFTYSIMGRLPVGIILVEEN